MSIKHRIEAYGELWRRYGAVLKYSWQQRSSMRTGLLNEQEAAFLPAALALQEKPGSPAARWTARILMLVVVVAVVWSVVGRIDIVVNAVGKVIPSAHTKTITAVDVAVVRSLKVKEGQKVKAGEVLVELDASAADAERDKAQGDSGAAHLIVARSNALIAAIEQGRSPSMPRLQDIPQDQWQSESVHVEGQYRDFKAKLTRIDGNIAHFSQALVLVTQRASAYKSLLAEHDVSEQAWLEKEQVRIDTLGQLTDARDQRAALISLTKKEAQDALADATRLAAASQQDAKRAGAHSKLLQLTSPVDGTVQQLNVHTVGAAVPAAQALMMIVPDENQVEVEAFVENKDIGFIEEGQTVAVKIDAFEYTKYGTVSAKITHVSRDAIQDEKKGLIYSVRITLDRSTIGVEGKTMPLSAGMSVNAEIKTGTRRVIEYVLSPLMQHQREALHER